MHGLDSKPEYLLFLSKSLAKQQTKEKNQVYSLVKFCFQLPDTKLNVKMELSMGIL